MEAEYYGLEELLAALEDAEEEWKKKQASGWLGGWVID